MVRKAGANPLTKCMTEESTGFVMKLPENLPGEAATQMADVILAARTNRLVFDVSAVRRIDTPCIQVLLSTARLWREDDVALAFSGETGSFDDNLNTLGLKMADLEVGDSSHA